MSNTTSSTTNSVSTSSNSPDCTSNYCTPVLKDNSLQAGLILGMCAVVAIMVIYLVARRFKYIWTVPEGPPPPEEPEDELPMYEMAVDIIPSNLDLNEVPPTYGNNLTTEGAQVTAESVHTETRIELDTQALLQPQTQPSESAEGDPPLYGNQEGNQPHLVFESLPSNQDQTRDPPPTDEQNTHQ